jgi:regulator of sirC expression with transglutaminase-like and TPR domain
MKPSLPYCCSPVSFGLMSRQLKSLESPDSLLHGALAVAMHQLESVNIEDIDQTLNEYAETIRRRVRGTQPQALMAHLHEVLFDEMGFAGDAEDYYNPANSYLPIVLDTKHGLPITLSLVYKIVAERIGLKVHGIGLPGHFMVSVESHGSPMLIDPFNSGQLVSVDEAHERMRQTVGPEAEWSEELLKPVSNLHWLTRILQNLLHIFGGAGQYSDVAAMLELEMLLWPKQTHLQRDLALVLARIGMSEPASAWLGKYLKNNPDDPQKSDLKQLLQVLMT